MEIKWKIEDLERRSSTGVVTVVHWRVTASQDEISASSYGTVVLDEKDSSEKTFIKFEKLTEKNVLSWVKEKLDCAAIESALINEIESKLNPEVITGMPW
jgi:hypothetical protein